MFCPKGKLIYTTEGAKDLTDQSVWWTYMLLRVLSQKDHLKSLFHGAIVQTSPDLIIVFFNKMLLSLILWLIFIGKSICIHAPVIRLPLRTGFCLFCSKSDFQMSQAKGLLKKPNRPEWNDPFEGNLVTCYPVVFFFFLKFDSWVSAEFMRKRKILSLWEIHHEEPGFPNRSA